MSKKLENNGLWESSRMMLPEHKERYIEGQQGLSRRSKPHMAEEEIEQISRSLGESYRRDRIVTIVLFDELEDIQHSGIVVKIDSNLGRVKMQQGEDFDWFRMMDIIKVF